jgi:hypothetical protein
MCNFTIFIKLFIQGKDKVPTHAMKTCRGTGGKAPLVLNFGTRQVSPFIGYLMMMSEYCTTQYLKIQ